MSEQESDVGNDLPPREALKRWVAQQATVLQKRYAADDGWAVARLAGLRGSSIESPQVWEVLSTLPPVLVGRGDEPSRGEAAAASALQLFALHQQSRRDAGMHDTEKGASLGAALRGINGKPEPEQAMTRRFHAMSQSSTLKGCLHHLRGLVQQLRAARVPLDYGQLAVDLWDFADPTTRDAVRLRWNRGYYIPPSTPPTDKTQDTTVSDDTTGELS